MILENKAIRKYKMKLVTILICVQAILMLASIAGSGYIMYNIKSDVASKKGEEFYKANSFLFYVTMALSGTCLIIHGLLTFWCRR